MTSFFLLLLSFLVQSLQCSDSSNDGQLRSCNLFRGRSMPSMDEEFHNYFRNFTSIVQLNYYDDEEMSAADIQKSPKLFKPRSMFHKQRTNMNNTTCTCVICQRALDIDKESGYICTKCATPNRLSACTNVSKSIHKDGFVRTFKYINNKIRKGTTPKQLCLMSFVLACVIGLVIAFSYFF